MSSDDNVKTIQAVYEAFGRGDIARAKSRTNGKSAAMTLHHHWKFRDGKIAYYRGAEDTLLTLRTFQP